MPHSLKSKVKSLCYKGELSEKERDRIIQALEQTELNPSYNGVKTELKPCDDCISREDILDAIETWDKFGVNAEQKLIRWNDHYVPYVHLDDVRNAIANIPSVTPQQTRWIPVSERLPENQDCYLVTTKWKGSYSGNVYIETNMAVYREKPKEWDCVDVIAWMPLPQPYAESEDAE